MLGDPLRVVNRIPGNAVAQEDQIQLGDHSDAGWASGLSTPGEELLPRRTTVASVFSQGSQHTASTMGSTLAADDDDTVSSLGDPEGTHNVDQDDGSQDGTRHLGDGQDFLPHNEPWRHELRRNEAIGDPLRLPKPDGWKRTRMCMQNPNGIQVNLEGKWKENCKHQREMEVDWMGYSGSDLNTTSYAVRKRLGDDAEDVFGYGSYKLVTGHTTRDSLHNRKPGGAMAIAVGWLRDKVFDSGADPYGRWVYTKLKGNQGRVITTICTYQVCQTDQVNIRELGESTFAKQQMSMFMEEGRRDPRRLRYHHRRDLIRFVQACQNKGELVMVGGDFNEVLGLEDTDGLAALCTECGLFDPILAKHGRTDFDTYIRGSKVLDYFLIPQELHGAVLDCGYEPYNIRTLGDHRAFYVDFDTVKLMGGKPTFSSKLENRDVNSKRHHQIPVYFKHRIKHLEDHKFFTQLEELRKCIETDTPNDKLAEKLDTRFQRSAKHAGGKCKRYPSVPYSPVIARLRNVCQLLRQAVAQHTHSCDMTEAMQATMDRAGDLAYDLPTTFDACQEALKNKRKELIEAEKEELNNAKLRRAYQDELIASHMDAGNKEHAQLLRQIKRSEVVSRIFR